MCGIAGIVGTSAASGPSEAELRQMLGMIRHRGPDQFGIYLDARAGLGSARLSIIDLGGGQQPIANEDGSLWIVFNGEIFNYVELRAELEGRGHRFSTHTDTEVILHLYEEKGEECLERLNGQFAIAIWDRVRQRLFLARDRLGVRPLFYTEDGTRFCFGSEIKALFALPAVRREIDPKIVREIFTFWAPLPGRTVFRQIQELPPGHCLTLENGAKKIRRYWQLDFAGEADSTRADPEDYLDRLQELLVDATRIRLRADVPVGAYLSGGLDSSTLAAVIRRFTGNHLDTFSIAFTDSNFDESQFQRRMADFLGTAHQVVEATHADIGRVFPEVIWHTEVPLMRTAPAPMFLLSQRVRQAGYKVVMTGEGADEFFGGYDIFKEAKVRRFCARQPSSRRRPRLFERLYPDIFGARETSGAFLASFFHAAPADLEAPEFSHAIRWRNNRRTCRFLADAGGEENRDGDLSAALGGLIPKRFWAWGPLERAQFLEIATFMSPYLLCSQGDRVAMAHSVEGRFPFLDVRLVEFCSRLPTRLKMRGLQEKFLLKQLSRRWLPPEIWQRGKRPYRAPIQRSLFNAGTADAMRELLSPENLRQTGLFKPGAVAQLQAKVGQGQPIGETDEMALAGIVSSQWVDHLFVRNFQRRAPLNEDDDVKICRPAA